MKSPLGVEVSRVGFRRSVERAYMKIFSGGPYLRVEMFLRKSHAQPTGSAVFLRASSVLLIACRRYVTEIRDTVVSGVAILVVYLVSGPHPVRVKPSQSLSTVFSAIDGYVDVSESASFPESNLGTGYISDSSFEIGHRFEASKNARLRVVQKQRPESFYGNIRLSHATLPRQVVRGPLRAETRADFDTIQE